MWVLGLSGGLDPLYATPEDYFLQHGSAHDSSAVLVKDGVVIAAIEEERLSRNKHTNKFPHYAIMSVLNYAKVDFFDLDAIAINMSKEWIGYFLKRFHSQNKESLDNIFSPEKKYSAIFQREFNVKIAEEKFNFVNHHITHAASTFYTSGFAQSLIMTLDGAGDGHSGSFLRGDKDGLHTLKVILDTNSLGEFYTSIIGFLGYTRFDEYKVMGLAPYGDPSVFREVFKKFYTLRAEGDYTVYLDKIYELYNYLLPRRSHEPFELIHKNIAASLQEVLEVIVIHMLQYYKEKTLLDSLCMAGGVAQNSSLNGAILNSGLFKKVFVQPASHDAGCALGAALQITYQQLPYNPKSQLTSVYWGEQIKEDEIPSELKKWLPLVEYRLIELDEVAQLLADGFVIGWVQGRSEFGPRALGNRSIIADPRPVQNKERINTMIKKREGYRPFAPSVLEEYVDEYFVLPPETETKFSFMTFVVGVRPKWRKTLAATTHVDGTARIQTVNKADNAMYWNLIAKFGKLTGIHVLLNTSFNNNAEPIVESFNDALVCYLTSGLDYLVVKNYLISKKPDFEKNILNYKLQASIALKLKQKICYTSMNDIENQYYLTWNYMNKRRKLNKELYTILQKSFISQQTIISIIEENKLIAKKEQILAEIFALWSERWVNLV